MDLQDVQEIQELVELDKLLQEILDLVVEEEVAEVDPHGRTKDKMEEMEVKVEEQVEPEEVEVED